MKINFNYNTDGEGEVEVLDFRPLKRINNSTTLSRLGRAELVAKRYKIDEELCRLYYGMFNFCPEYCVKRLVRERIEKGGQNE